MEMNLNFNLSGLKEENKAVELNENTVYDVIILGGGPAAMTAAVYCMRKGAKTAMITKDVGGQVAITASVENYMGYKYIEGLELVTKFHEQIKQFEIGYRENVSVTAIRQGHVKEISLDDGSVFQGKTIIVATGKSPRWLEVPGESEFMGRGVAYCATCDTPLYRNRKVVVVGGGNSGVEAAIDLARIAGYVTLIQRSDTLKADQILIERLQEFQNYKTLLNHEVVEILGSEYVESTRVKDRVNQTQKIIECEGVFVEIGWIPNTVFVKDLLQINRWNEIMIDCSCQTNQAGIFAAGDVTSVPFKQIITAAGDGAKAALAACDYFLKMR